MRMMCMPSYSKSDIILVRYPFSVIGQLADIDARQLEQSLQDWLGI